MEAKGASPSILDQYDADKSALDKFAAELERLLRTLLQAGGVKFHSVTSRVKERDSLARKIDGIPPKYSQLADITDVVGLRVITYFEDTVDDVAKIVEREFEVDQENSEDKRQVSDPERFGYASLHYVVRLSAGRVRHEEYRRFSGMKAEIQVRSVLQHAWAEIEHDLGYKSKDVVPYDYRRGFARLAGLLELADSEFVRLRDEIRTYEKDVRRQIEEHPAAVAVDKASLIAYARHDPLVKKYDRLISSRTGRKPVLLPDMLEGWTKAMYEMGWKRIGDLQKRLTESGPRAVDLVVEMNKGTYWPYVPKGDRFAAGSVLLYLGYLDSASGPEGALERYIRSMLPEGGEFAKVFADIVRKAVGALAGGVDRATQKTSIRVNRTRSKRHG